MTAPVRLSRSVKPAMRWVHCPACGARADRVADPDPAPAPAIATFVCGACAQETTAQVDGGGK